MPNFEPLWSKQGVNFHEREEQLFHRRNLTRFDLKSGKKWYNQKLKSHNLQLHGVVDFLIETKNSIYAVDFKCSRSVRYGHRLQLGAYAMLAEEYFGKSSKLRYILTENNRTVEVVVDYKLRSSVIDTKNRIIEMLPRLIHDFQYLKRLSYKIGATSSQIRNRVHEILDSGDTCIDENLCSNLFGVNGAAYLGMISCWRTNVEFENRSSRTWLAVS